MTCSRKLYHLPQELPGVGYGWAHRTPQTPQGTQLKIRHIYRAPYHPQTNGKLERFHETLKARLNLLVYTSPESLQAALAEFIDFYNYRRYHEGIRNVTPADVCFRRREEILKRREVLKRRTLEQLLQYNLGQSTGEPVSQLSVPVGFNWSQMS